MICSIICMIYKVVNNFHMQQKYSLNLQRSTNDWIKPGLTVWVKHIVEIKLKCYKLFCFELSKILVFFVRGVPSKGFRALIHKVCFANHWWSVRLTLLVRESLNKEYFVLHGELKNVSAPYTRKVWEPLA